jgi:hypothetical protein
MAIATRRVAAVSFSRPPRREHWRALLATRALGLREHGGTAIWIGTKDAVAPWPALTSASRDSFHFQKLTVPRARS